MNGEVSLLVWGAAAGLVSAVILEVTKGWLDRSRTTHQEGRELKKARDEQISQFLRGENAPDQFDPAPSPAWLRQVSVARRYPLARLGLRSDEDYRTAAYLTTCKPASRRSVTLLKTFRRGGTRSRQPAQNRGGKFLLGPAHILGRGSQCDIQVLDPAVSLLHAFIRFEGDRYQLYDLGSTGGTFVNGDLVGPLGVPLEGGEQIRMGETTFEFGRAAKGTEVDPADPFLIL
jgi:hypothetical protein